jgi:hypothetical protein
MSVREIILMLGVGMLALGLMLAPRGVLREQPILKETGFTSMAKAGAFEEGSKMLRLIGTGVFVISFLPLPPWRGRKTSPKKPKK